MPEVAGSARVLAVESEVTIRSAGRIAGQQTWTAKMSKAESGASMVEGVIGPTLLWAVNHPKEVKGLYDAVKGWWGPKTEAKAVRGVLVLGPGGCGKTTLGKILSGKYEILTDSLKNYDESLTTEIIEPGQKSRPRVVIPPGQRHRWESEWRIPLNDLATGKYSGLVLLGSFGYHSIGELDLRLHPLWKGKMRQFVRDYTADCLNEEIAALNHVSASLRANVAPIWVLNVVTKEDLWTSERDAVSNFYGQGKFGTLLREVLNSKDASQFRVEVVLTSLTIHNFTTSRGELMQKTTAGYDHTAYAKSLLRLLKSLDDLRKWEQSNVR
jgi:energy-coupling factor transporter ATP-binding protein EcfA2